MAQTPTTFEVDGTAICNKRMNAGMEVQQLADLVGITANYLRKVERGVRTRMRPGPYQALRAALNATEDELLAPHPDPPERK
ncbi:helix-turn-helix transcriptional regulator [Streptomyces tuirus]|uniref:Helix-turn-helix transcriptional regulator n=1 Tax=Streptomyces tuirus TaxID=68278 RepID=A0A941J436_9ACTN|nr:helix-turn-helix transcriptional regulator [Streptomyces tuirus]